MGDFNLAVDRLSTEERNALDAGGQVSALNEVIGEIKALTRFKIEAIDLKRITRHAKIMNPTPENRAAESDALCAIERLKTLIEARKEDKSTLQTLVNAIPKY